jgi:hypothetical protein
MVGEHVHLPGAVMPEVRERVEMHVDKTEECAGRGELEDIDRECIPPLCAWKLHAPRLAQAEASGPDPRAIGPRCVNGGKALAGQQSHGRELHSRKRRFVLRIGHKEGTADVRIV